MAALEWEVDISLDGVAYPASRGNQGERQYAVQYVPKIKSANQTEARTATLDPLELVTFHRGAGASRSIGVPGMVSYGKNIWTCDAGVLLPGPEVTTIPLAAATRAPRPDGVQEADGNIYVAAGQVIYRLAAGQAFSPAPAVDFDFSADFVGLAMVRFGSSLFCSTSTTTGGASLLNERPDGSGAGGWLGSPLGSVAVQPSGALGTVWWTTGAAGASLTTQRLVAQFGTRGVRYCATAPRQDTNWTPGLATPGIDIKAPIQRFVTTLDHLYVATTSGLRDLDSSGLAPNLTPELEDGQMATGGLAALARGGFAYISGAYDLYTVAVSGQSYAQAQPITPLMQLPNEAPIAAYGVDLVARGRYLIYAMWDEQARTSWVCWGRAADTGQNSVEVGPMVWNVAPIVMSGFKVSCLWISGLATDGPRLWMFGTTQPGGVVQARWAPLAYTTPYADLKGGRGRRFATSCELTLPSEDGGEDAIPKDVEEIQCESEALFGGNTIKVSGAKEGDPVYTPLATFSSGPRIVAGIKEAFVSQRPTFKLELAGSPLTPPILRRLSIRWLPNPDLREVRKYILQLGRYQRFGSSSLVGRGAMEQASRLVDLAMAATRTTLIDEAGVAYTVRVLSIDGPAEVEAETDGDRMLTIAVTLSIFGRQPGPPFDWDAGVPYDSGRSWS